MGGTQTIPYSDYQKLPPDKRSRPLSDAEYAALSPEQLEAVGLAEPREGAPANFSGVVLPNPDHVTPRWDTEPIPATRLPRGVTFEKGNYTGGAKLDLSNPLPTEAIPTAGRTIAADMSEKPAHGPWEKYAATSAAHGPWEKYGTTGPAPSVKQPAATEEEKISEPSFFDTLGREAKSAASALNPVTISSGIYHAFSDQPTAEEQKEFSTDKNPGVIKRGAIGVTRMTAEPIANAADWYIKAAQGKIPNVTDQILSVAPEGIGAAAGNVVGGKAIEGAVNVAKGAPVSSEITAVRPKPSLMDPAAGPEIVAPIVRSAARGANKALANYPKIVGSTVGGAVGAASRIPYGTEIGAGIGAAVGPEILPNVRIPGEHFGLPARVVGGPRIAPAYVEPTPVFPGANLPEHPGVFPGAPLPAVPSAEIMNPALVSEARTLPGQISPEVISPPAAKIPSAAPIPSRSGLMLPAAPEETAAAAPKLTTATGRIKPAVSRDLGRLLNEATGGEPIEALKPGVPLRSQTAAATETALPEGFTPTKESSALKGYKYDPTAREFEYITKDGSHYVRGDVDPAAATQFEQTAEKTGSFGKAWHELRNNPQGGVGQFKVINGKRVAVVKTAPVTDLAEQIKNSAEPSKAPSGSTVTDLAKQIKQSAKASAKTSGNVIPKAAPEGDLSAQLKQMADRVKGGESLKDITASAAKPGSAIEKAPETINVPGQGEVPRYVYRARDVGEKGIPSANHAQAGSNLERIQKYAEAGQRSPEAGEVVKIDLAKLKPEDFVIRRHPDGSHWVQFKRPLTENEVASFSGENARAK